MVCIRYYAHQTSCLQFTAELRMKDNQLLYIYIYKTRKSPKMLQLLSQELHSGVLLA